jgi:hypothetical protein
LIAPQGHEFPEAQVGECGQKQESPVTLGNLVDQLDQAPIPKLTVRGSFPSPAPVKKAPDRKLVSEHWGFAI